MTNPIEVIDQGRLELTMSVRENIIRDLTKNKSVPNSADDRMLLVAALDGLDRAVVQKSKLKIDASANENAAQATNLIADLIMKRSVVLNAKTRNEEPILGDAYIVDTPVDGEKEVGSIQLTYDTFVDNQ